MNQEKPTDEQRASVFQDVNTRVAFPELERELEQWWQQNGVIAKTLESGDRDNPFVFFEGPPTANNKPGIHHVESRAAKDVIVRFQRDAQSLRDRGARGLGLPRSTGRDRGRAGAWLLRQAGHRGLRHRKVQRDVPTERRSLHRRLGKADRSDGLLDRP